MSVGVDMLRLEVKQLQGRLAFAEGANATLLSLLGAMIGTEGRLVRMFPLAIVAELADARKVDVVRTAIRPTREDGTPDETKQPVPGFLVTVDDRPPPETKPRLVVANGIP